MVRFRFTHVSMFASRMPEAPVEGIILDIHRHMTCEERHDLRFEVSTE
jgi:hypothetical protein